MSLLFRNGLPVSVLHDSAVQVSLITLIVFRYLKCSSRATLCVCRLLASEESMSQSALDDLCENYLEETFDCRSVLEQMCVHACMCGHAVLPSPSFTYAALDTVQMRKPIANTLPTHHHPCFKPCLVVRFVACRIDFAVEDALPQLVKWGLVKVSCT